MRKFIATVILVPEDELEKFANGKKVLKFLKLDDIHFLVKHGELVEKGYSEKVFKRQNDVLLAADL